MMPSPVKFSGRCIYLGAPKDWDIAKFGECYELPVFVEGAFYRSCWEFSQEELEQLQKSKRLYITLVGGQPPISILVSEDAKN